MSAPIVNGLTPAEREAESIAYELIQAHARIRALEAEVARKDAVLRQIAEPRNWEEQDKARSIARAALGPWVPTHRHYLDGSFVRELLRAGHEGHDRRVIYDMENGFIAWATGESFDGDAPRVRSAFGVLSPPIRRYRPLTPDEARAAVEGRSDG